jgi:hypothetical protein
MTVRGMGAPAVSAGDEKKLPAEYSLLQNYPNPFNPDTRIPYSIPERSQVRLVVFDGLGREVAVLVERVQEPGMYVVSFDAARLATGTYFCRLSAGGQDFVRRMQLLK